MSGDELKTLRRKVGMTQAQVAELIGVTSNAVALWERGERAISEPVARLVRYLVVDRTCSAKHCGGMMTRIGFPPSVRKTVNRKGYEARFTCTRCGRVE